MAFMSFDDFVSEVERARPRTRRISEVQLQRDEWLQSLVDGVIRQLGETGEHLIGAIRPGMGRPDLMAALFTARVATWVGGGYSIPQVVEKASKLEVLSSNQESQRVIRSTAEVVSATLSHRGFGIGEEWRPETGYLLLLEVWAAEQRERVGDQVFREQLRDGWNESDGRALPYLMGLVRQPLTSYRSLRDRVDDCEYKDVADLVVDGSGQDSTSAERQRQLRALNLESVPHLQAFASDVITIRLVRTRLVQFAKWARESGENDFAELAAETVRFLSQAHDETTDLLAGLSEYEVSRLVLDGDRRLQDACLDAYVSRYRLAPVRDQLRSRHGTFGALPWWRVPVTEENIDLVQDTVETRSGGFTILDDEGSLLPLVLCSPSGEGHFVFDFELDRFEDLCELVLIGRSGRVCIDFEGTQDGDRVRFGTVGLGMADELAEQLLGVATPLIRRMLGADDGLHDYAEVRRAVSGFFNEPTLSWSRPAEQFVPWDRL